MEPLVLYLDLDVQLRLFVPNLLVDAAKVDMGAGTTLETQLRLLHPQFEAILQSMENDCG
jgi:hypothetical protein